MAASSRIRIRRIAEVTPGTTPAGDMDIVPYATWSMTSPITRQVGANVSSDRQARDNGATDRQTGGSATSDYIYGMYDPEISAAFCAAQGAAVTVTGTDIAAVASGNKLTKGSGGWSTLAAGDFVKVTGFTTNGATFIGKVSAVSGGDLTLTRPTLSNESAGASVTVAYVAKQKLGTALRTLTYESLNLASTKGEAYRKVGVNSFSLSVPEKGHCVLNFGYTGGGAPERLAAALANASAAANTNPIRSGPVHFLGAAVPTQGLGFYYGNTLMDDLRITTLKLTVTNPLLAYGGAKDLGPTALDLDGEFVAMLDLTFHRDSDEAETLIADHDNTDTVTAIEFGFRDASGLRDLWSLPELQPQSESTDGVKKTGQEIVTLQYVARQQAATASLLQYFKLG